MVIRGDHVEKCQPDEAVQLDRGAVVFRRISYRGDRYQLLRSADPARRHLGDSADDTA